MTGAAWTMMLVTWGIIGFFTVRFFLKVLRTPHPEDDGPGPDGPAR